VPSADAERPGRTRRWFRPAAFLPGPVTTPFTFFYLAVLLISTIILRVLPDRVADRVLAMSSTDANNLWHRPLLSLVTSALWLADAKWSVYVLLFALILAPLERRVGPLWTAAVFVSGHVLATLATELPVMWAIRTHLLPHSDARWLDIGVSYGLFAAAGALLPILAAPARAWIVLALESSILLIYVASDPASLEAVVTLAGHLFALHLGLFGWLPWLRRRGLVGTFRLSGPPWLRAARAARPTVPMPPPPVVAGK
jgi:hypothetical protein